jgi:hypothetical protein
MTPAARSTSDFALASEPRRWSSAALRASTFRDRNDVRRERRAAGEGARAGDIPAPRVEVDATFDGVRDDSCEARRIAVNEGGSGSTDTLGQCADVWNHGGQPEEERFVENE